MHILPLLNFKPDCGLSEDAAGTFNVQHRNRIFSIASPSPGLRNALQRLATSGASKDDLGDELLRSEGMTAVARLFYYLKMFDDMGCLVYSLYSDRELLLSLEPLFPGYAPVAEEVPEGQTVVLSRFAYCRRVESSLAVECPLSPVRVRLYGTAGAALVVRLATPASSAEIAAKLPEVNPRTTQAALAFLLAAEVISKVDGGDAAEDGDEALMQWEFHDLLFHARSRHGRHDSGNGATYRFLGRLPPAPPVKPAMSRDSIPLHRPDLDELRLSDVPFTQVLETRASIRDHPGRVITATQLGDFLFRAARVRGITEAGRGNKRPYSVTSRPYPGGGAAYELEIYPIVRACEGLEPGLYHYEPVKHALSKLSEPNRSTAALLRGAAGAAGRQGEPQILLGITARFKRLMWKYETIAYAVILKDVGVLYQTMYLVATAMGLAPCGLGSGDSDLLAKAAGVRYLEESAVGEFMLSGGRC
jgi:SagB-type dehydrogenase family enzyme